MALLHNLTISFPNQLPQRSLGASALQIAISVQRSDAHCIIKCCNTLSSFCRNCFYVEPTITSNSINFILLSVSSNALVPKLLREMKCLRLKWLTSATDEKVIYVLCWHFYGLCRLFTLKVATDRLISRHFALANDYKENHNSATFYNLVLLV